MYIYEQADWPHFRWNAEKLLPLLGNVRNRQGRLIGKMESLGFELQSEAVLQMLTLDVVKSSEIEGEMLDTAQVRSSIARRLGMDSGGLLPADRNVEGVVEMMLDATQNYRQPLTEDRLFGWHCALFPTGRNGIYRITVGNWRTDARGPMQVVSGAIGREKVHFQAPPANRLSTEMAQLLEWLNRNGDTDPVIAAAIAHLWFVTIHPFEDGNGRIARALTDMLLARADGMAQRFYSMSAQIRLQRRAYYEILEKTQKETTDITAWLTWFLDCLLQALTDAEEILLQVMRKYQFWSQYAATTMNDRQRLMLNKLLDGFEGQLTSAKWAKITKCSLDTALRDIQQLMDKQILRKTAAGGRSTAYELAV